MKKVLETKDQLIRYIITYKPPDEFIRERLTVIRFDHYKEEWTWAKGQLMGCSLDLLINIINELENYYGS